MPGALRLLGSPRYRAADSWSAIPVRQLLLLGAYLACKGDWASRDELVHLFWPDVDDRIGRHNLSQLLYYGKRQAWFEGVEAERNRIRWLVLTDVQQFRNAVREGAWAEATACYQGQLLDGVRFEGSANFEEWLHSEREALHSAWREAALNHAVQLESQGRFAEAAGLLREVLRQDGLAEDVLQAYMGAAARCGHREQALKAYETFVKQLESEFGMEPLEGTQGLAERIRLQELTPQLVSEDVPTESAKPHDAKLRNFPVQLTPFIGRDLELAELSGLFQDAGARLITLLGPGGVGKTRLALELARQHAGSFQSGAVFVPLESLRESSQIAPAIVDALGLRPPPRQDPQAYALSSLAAEEVLLVLDNFEHLLAGAGLLMELLEASPRLRILATSREPLGFQGEALYDLKGLAYPTTDQHDIEDFDAVALFLRCARRSHSTFTLMATDHSAVVQVCRRLEGLPLGLELAAPWVRLLTPAEIVEEIDKNLALLRAEFHDAPARHQTLRAVFEHSWNLLTEEEQGALKRLSVFHGGFTKEAAQVVVGANLRTLLSLVNKCLLVRTQAGRFERHVAVYQFAREKLAREAEEYQRYRHRHAEHFLDLAETAEAKLRGPEQGVWFDKLAEDHDNLWAALQYTLEAPAGEMGLRFGALLWEFWYTRGEYSEGLSYLETVLDLPETGAYPLRRAKALNSAGILAHGQGRLEDSRRYFQQNLEIVRAADDKKALSDALNNLGNVAQERADYLQAYRYHEESLALRRQLEDSWGATVSLNNLGNVAHVQGDYARARGYFHESLAVSRQSGDAMRVAYSLTGLGNVAFEVGNYREARAHYEQALTIRRGVDFKWGMADVLNRLAQVALEQRDLEAVRAFHRESLTIKLDSGDRWGVAETLEGLAMLAALEGRLQEALRLAGAAAVVRENVGTPLPQADRERLERYLKSARQRLGKEAARAFSEGRAMTLDNAVRLSRQVLAAASLPSAAKSSDRTS